MAGEDFEWRAGGRHPASRRVNRGTFEFPPPIGRRRMIRYPAGEHVTVPRHVDTRAVRTLAERERRRCRTRGSPPLAPVLAPAVQLALRTPARRAIEAAVARLPDGPAAGRPARLPLHDRLRRGPRRQRRRGVISGSDVYGVTARATVRGGSADGRARLRAQRRARPLAGVRPASSSSPRWPGSTSATRSSPDGEHAASPIRPSARARSAASRSTRWIALPPAGAEAEASIGLPLGSANGGGARARSRALRELRLRARARRRAPTRRASGRRSRPAARSVAEPRQPPGLDRGRGLGRDRGRPGRLMLTPKSLALLAERAGRRIGEVRTPSSRRGQAWMWQTLLNGLTFHPNFAREVRAGRLRPSNAREPGAFVADAIVTVLGGPARAARLGAARAGRVAAPPRRRDGRKGGRRLRDARRRRASRA